MLKKRLSMLLLVAVTCGLIPATARAQAVESATCERPSVEPGSSQHTLMSGDMERTYIVYIPESYDPTQPTPVVFSLHGFALSARQQQGYSQFDRVAETEGFIAVYPMGSGAPARWYAYDRPVFTGERNSIDDVAFINAVIDELEANYCVDSARVYASGLSNGGGMSKRLACELSDRVAAVALVAAAVVADEPCSPTRPVPFFAMHGTEDPVVPYTGEEEIMAAEDYVAQWVEINGCTGEPYREAFSAVGEDYALVSWRDCADGAQVDFYTLNGGGHTWPGSAPLLPLLVGRTFELPDASDTIWAFFEAHPMPQS